MKKYMVPKMAVYALNLEERIAGCGDESFKWLEGGDPSQDILNSVGKYSGCEYDDMFTETVTLS